MPSVTLPGGGKVKYSLPVGTDEKVALTKAIKSEFTAAGKNITMNVVASGKAGTGDFFNAVLNKGGSADVSLTAGKGVQAIFDIGKGADTLTGGTSTSLIYGNATSKNGDSISVVGKTTVFGTAGADTLNVTDGTATAYLEGGKNVVNLTGEDTLTLVGTGAATITAGSGAVSVVGGTGTINFTHGAGAVDTVSITKNKGTDTLSGALNDKKGGDVFNISSKAGGKFVITDFSGTADKIVTGATAAQITVALNHAKTTVKGGVTTTTIKIGSDKITVIGDAVTKTNFTH